jgi:hypothetical protein
MHDRALFTKLIRILVFIKGLILRALTAPMVGLVLCSTKEPAVDVDALLDLLRQGWAKRRPTSALA